jgi:hypothetical protein
VHAWEAVTGGQQMTSPTWGAYAACDIPLQTITKRGQEPTI